MPGWLLPLIGLLILLPLLWFLMRGCSPAGVYDNGNANRVVSTANMNANRMMNGNMNAGAMTAANTGGNPTVEKVAPDGNGGK